MRILLDTHYLIWSLADTKKIDKKLQSILLDDQNDIFVSKISFWEISLKYSIGKLKLQKLKVEDFLNASKKSGYNILPFDENQAVTFYKLPLLKNKDPFDRMLIWQAIQNNLTLMTIDKKIIKERKNLKISII